MFGMPAEQLCMRWDMFGTWIEYNGIWVKAWPDNDGGLWFYHPVTGKAVRYEENESDNQATG